MYLDDQNISQLPDRECTAKHMLACATDMTINKGSEGLPPVNPDNEAIFALDLYQLTTLMKRGSVLGKTLLKSPLNCIWACRTCPAMFLFAVDKRSWFCVIAFGQNVNMKRIKYVHNFYLPQRSAGRGRQPWRMPTSASNPLSSPKPRNCLLRK